MKTIMRTCSVLIGLLAMTASVAASTGTNNVVTMAQLQRAEASRLASTLALTRFSMIDWKVGDSQSYKVSLGMGLEGTMQKEAFKEEGDAIWIRQQLKLPIANDNSEMLIDRNSGRVLKFIRNGKEEAIPEGDIEVISTEMTTVEVPAGKFKVLHVKAKSKDVSDIQIWANPQEISLDGAAKVYMDQGMLKVTMVLTKFVKN